MFPENIKKNNDKYDEVLDEMIGRLFAYDSHSVLLLTAVLRLLSNRKILNFEQIDTSPVPEALGKSANRLI